MATNNKSQNNRNQSGRKSVGGDDTASFGPATASDAWKSGEHQSGKASISGAASMSGSGTASGGGSERWGSGEASRPSGKGGGSAGGGPEGWDSGGGGGTHGSASTGSGGKSTGAASREEMWSPASAGDFSKSSGMKSGDDSRSFSSAGADRKETSGNGSGARGIDGEISNDIVHAVKDVASATMNAFRGEAKALMGGVTSDLSHLADSQKEKGAEQIKAMARALSSAAGEFERESPAVAQLVRDMGGTIERLSDTIRGKSPGELWNSIADAAKKQPMLLFGAALLAGIAATRFLKSSAAQAAASSGSMDAHASDDDYYADASRRHYGGDGQSWESGTQSSGYRSGAGF